MTIFLFEVFATLALASGQQAGPAQPFSPPTPRSQLEQLILSKDPNANVAVVDWLKARKSDPATVQRELTAIGFVPMRPMTARCEAHVYERIIGDHDERLRASIELCPEREPAVLRLRYFKNMQAPDPNASAAPPMISTPTPPWVKPQ